MSRSRRLSRVLGLVLTLSLLPLTAVAGTSATSPRRSRCSAGGPRRAATPSCTLRLVSRTFNVSTNNWTVVVDATLDSNYLCFPLLFDCIVGELADPPNANLTDLQCLSPLWNHLIVFRNHCLQAGRPRRPGRQVPPHLPDRPGGHHRQHDRVRRVRPGVCCR